MGQPQKLKNALSHAEEIHWKASEGSSWSSCQKGKAVRGLTRHGFDNAGNLVDEECVIETLDAASDYDRGVETTLR